MNELSPENYTLEVAEAVVNKLENLTSSQNLSTSEVNDTVDVLESIVALQEQVLEAGGNLNLSNEFVDVRLRQSYTANELD